MAADRPTEALLTPEHCRILVVDDAADAREVIQTQLEDQGYRVAACSSVEEALALLATTPFDLIITDLRMPRASGLELVGHVRAALPDTEIMMVTGYPTIKGAVEAVKTGAEHYLAKPFTEHELVETVGAVVAKLARRRLAHDHAPAIDGAHGIVGRSPAMQRVFRLIDRAGGTAATVLIAGESGTGKELVARAIHYAGEHRGAPFVSVNCAAIPEHLIESELFGHVQGAFTGAVASRRGFFEMAAGGTLFLDEIGDASPAMQAKLLRAIEEKIIHRLGSSRPVRIDARLVFATNKDLAQLIDRGLFREDLYYRINVIDIPLPPLRERGDDLLLLVNHFRARYGRDLGRPAPLFSDETLRRLVAYHWPGNVRELENLVQRLVLLAEGERIEPADLPATLRPVLDLPRRLDRRLAEHEADYIRAVLASVDGNKTRAAAILGIDRKTLRDKLGRQG
ncbi:sigma-54-dependent Fis family transcriptional regulator [Desulfoprunum benzoelyticum]|uniref:DNA-binding NtrC family response regulator n=1 Tax=Desulfoprunum benzoelyticum TaxID=1506996 RepID=A0A840V5F1_9BACT|nr:sigma-54 dependent transcriptional regulator [Desulfoprunum benzoelyticum]MBB5349140.1 DNA-binding NtrC family response regulator [Desulfoprunum benzoelyticum]MBM9530622.1 sigma-54-dependent Fis family transcriptional regulator [Desulfoprunum benzoelyticum]